jgi:hypothetical protein
MTQTYFKNSYPLFKMYKGCLPLSPTIDSNLLSSKRCLLTTNQLLKFDTQSRNKSQKWVLQGLHCFVSHSSHGHSLQSALGMVVVALQDSQFQKSNLYNGLQHLLNLLPRRLLLQLFLLLLLLRFQLQTLHLRHLIQIASTAAALTGRMLLFVLRFP